MKRLALTLAIVACLGTIGVGAGLAATAKAYPTTSTVEVKSKTIEGKISSPKAACLKNRKVVGTWRGPGVHATTEPATSNGSGKWVIQFEVAPGDKGTLTISVSPKSLGGGVTCKGFAV
ncbi:MAG TPA: hypothetical protein VHA76_03970, partial [Solirubrobacterales bacterium]|nr:hypothetical protein [Solirubrobacterales bacterium]